MRQFGLDRPLDFAKGPRAKGRRQRWRNWPESPVRAVGWLNMTQRGRLDALRRIIERSFDFAQDDELCGGVPQLVHCDKLPLAGRHDTLDTFLSEHAPTVPVFTGAVGTCSSPLTL